MNYRQYEFIYFKMTIIIMFHAIYLSLIINSLCKKNEI